jgi:hypothetical protein
MDVATPEPPIGAAVMRRLSTVAIVYNDWYEGSSLRAGNGGVRRSLCVNADGGLAVRWYSRSGSWSGEGDRAVTVGWRADVAAARSLLPET